MGLVTYPTVWRIGTLFLFLAVGLMTFTSVAHARACPFQSGEKRWLIKTTLPATHLTSRTIDLQSLLDLQNPTVNENIDNIRWSGQVTAKDDSGSAVTLREGDIITVSAYVYRARCQADGDYHIEIGTQKTRAKAQCLIVEVPDPGQIQDAGLNQQVTGARNSLESMDASVFQPHPTKGPIEATITGQLFLDEPHARKTDPSGGRGTLLASKKHCASNLWELHPVTSITNP